MQTLERSYLLRINGKVVERPQHMLMRVSVGIHKDDIDSAIQTYHLLSERWFTHASPTLFNSGELLPHQLDCRVVACASNDRKTAKPGRSTAWTLVACIIDHLHLRFSWAASPSPHHLLQLLCLRTHLCPGCREFLMTVTGHGPMS